MDAREERLLTVHARECEWTLGGGPLKTNDCTYSIVGILKANTYLLNVIQEGPHQKLFFHLQESEDVRRARMDEKI